MSHCKLVNVPDDPDALYCLHCQREQSADVSPQRCVGRLPSMAELNLMAQEELAHALALLRRLRAVPSPYAASEQPGLLEEVDALLTRHKEPEHG